MSDARGFRVTLAYDGTEFHGWQRQPGVRTVQGTLEAALSSALATAVEVHGAGRTDAGVHARGQVASFAAVTPLPARGIAALAQRHLPGDVRIEQVEEVAPEFHARHDAVARRYEYRLLARPDLLLERVAWWPRRPWVLERLDRAAAPLVGTHDCTAFESATDPRAYPIVRITRARWAPWVGGAAFEVRADHFLYHMVRNLVGTMLHASHEADPAAHMRAVLATRDRRAAAVTAAAQGLSLEAVDYAPLPEDAA